MDLRPGTIRVLAEKAWTKKRESPPKLPRLSLIRLPACYSSRPFSSLTAEIPSRGSPAIS